jgi:hypothetical protein
MRRGIAMERPAVRRMIWGCRVIVVVLAMVAIACHGEGRRQEQREAQNAFWSQQVNRERVEQFAYANARFALLHELAHFVFNEYQVPIEEPDKEEDEADRFAIRLMAPSPTSVSPAGGESTSSPTASELVWVAYWWIEQGRLRVQNRIPIPWNAVHRPSEERGYQMLCLLYGSNPARFEELATEFGLAQERRQTCVGEAASNTARWKALLGAYQADPAERAANRARYASSIKSATDGAPGSLASRVLKKAPVPTPVSMRMFSYEPYESPEALASLDQPTLFWDSQAFLERRHMLEAVVDDMLALKIPANKTLPHVAAMGCEGEGNAHYGNVERSGGPVQMIYICYPLVDSFAWSARNLFWADEQAKTSK